MKRRIGNDLGLEVAVKRNGRPEDLSALASLKVAVKSVYGAILPFSYTILDNRIVGVIFGKDQKQTGDYLLEIVENDGLENMTTWDGHLVTLVDHTYKESDCSESPDSISCMVDINDSDLGCDVDISIAKNGLSAYEIALSRGFVGTVDEWLDSLGKPAREAAEEARKAGEDAKQTAQAAGKEAREIAEGAAREAGDAALSAQTATAKANAAARSAEDASQEASTQAENARIEAQKANTAITLADVDHKRAEADHVQAVEDKLDLENTKGRVTNLEKVVPSQASEENKLADREFVNSSIATATATFRGTFERIGGFPSEGDANDYVFLKVLDEKSGQVVRYDRYKWSAQGWLFEYSLNNSSFTQAQWDAINSGATAELFKAIDDAIKGKQDELSEAQMANIAAVPGKLDKPEHKDITILTSNFMEDRDKVGAYVLDVSALDATRGGQTFPLYEVVSGHFTTDAPMVDDKTMESDVRVQASSKVFVYSYKYKGTSRSSVVGRIDGLEHIFYEYFDNTVQGRYAVKFVSFIDDSYLSPNIARIAEVENLVKGAKSILVVDYEDIYGDDLPNDEYAVIRVGNHTILPSASCYKGWLYQYSEGWRVVPDFSSWAYGISTKTWEEILNHFDEISVPLGGGGGTECTEEDIMEMFGVSDFSGDFNGDFGTNL